MPPAPDLDPTPPDDAPDRRASPGRTGPRGRRPAYDLLMGSLVAVALLAAVRGAARSPVIAALLALLAVVAAASWLVRRRLPTMPEDAAPVVSAPAPDDGGDGPGVAAAERLRVWAEALCRAATDEVADLAVALELAAPAVRPRQPGKDGLVVQPPPPGCRQVRIEHGAVELIIDGELLTSAVLDRALGERLFVPTLPSARLVGSRYRVVVDGAAAACSVFVGLQPPDGPAREIRLRREAG